MMLEKARGNKLDRLSNLECIREYEEPIQTKRRNVLLVAADDSMPAPNVTAHGTANIYAWNTFDASAASTMQSAMNSYGWICSDDTKLSYRAPCSTLIDAIKSKPDHWKVGHWDGEFSNTDITTYPVDYCLSEKSEPRCKVQFMLSIAILVTVLNIFKAVLIFYTALGTKENPLMTMGDAVASFLERRDGTTKEILFVTLGVVAGLLGYGVQQLPAGTPRSVAGLASLGYGAIDYRTIMAYSATGISTIGYTLIANVAQPILSFLYFSYNGLFTAMLLGYEWVSYAHHRKGLRVSRPAEGAQRSTYFLQLPYRFALPLMVLSGVLHWLVSQSIFLVAIDVYDFDGAHTMHTSRGTVSENGPGDWKSTGYSPIAIFTTVMLGTVMTLAAIGMGFVPFNKGMNLAGSCSAAISAACHEVDEVDGFEVARSKLQWGVVGVNAEGVGHCTFSTREVEMPKVGQMYAGQTTSYHSDICA
ncbi:hypothetical protein SLS60_001795 [Paraconiothyrium brasiliense]|uniref:Uncharacterized protein n=1 Tax=Paraconiothyrium brasiliense TaxID=300254 RepID=A0ABR3S0D7_9PLEO